MISGVIVSQVAAYGILALLLIRIIIPELKAVRESPFLDYAIKQAKRKKYLVTYVCLSLISSALMIGFSEGATQNPGQGRFWMAVILAWTAAILSIIALSYLPLWIFYFFRQGKNGLFQDLYVSGSRIQDAIRPFMWILFLIVAGVSLLTSALMTVSIWDIDEFKITTLLLTLALIIAHTFVFLAFFVYMGFKGIGVSRLILGMFGASFLYIGLTWLLTIGFARLSGIKLTDFLEVVDYLEESQIFMTAAAIIAATLMGWLFYWRFMKGEPGRWIEKTG